MGHRSFPRRMGAGLLAALAVLPALADDTKPALTAEQKQRNLASFDYVWKTVRDKHWDPKLNGLDWDAVRTELRPKAEKAATTAEARALMSQMLGRLGQSHFAILPRDIYQALDKPADKTGAADTKAGAGLERSGDGTAGLEIRIVDGHALITKVDEQAPAAKLGVKPGWLVVKVRDQDIAPLLERARKTYKGSTLLELRLSRAVEGRLTGKPGTKVPVVFRDGTDKDVPLDVPLMRPAGRVAGLGHLPGTHVRVEARRLEGNVGYVALNAFFDPVNVRKEFEKVLWTNPRPDALILDLRGNPGGIGGMAMGIGNWFVQKPDQKLGTMKLRNATINFVLNPQAETFTGPVAVLIDGCSASTSEILAGGLKDLKLAHIFGTRTAGAALPSLIERLPNGDGFQFAIANYISSGGQVLEGTGVVPDVEVKPERKALLAGRDPVIDAALAWIKAQK